MNGHIQSAVACVVEAKITLQQILKREQEKCSHKIVIHSKWRGSDWGSAFKARRLCLDCGLEEEAKHNGWGDSDSDFKYLKTDGFHKVVSSNEIYRNRVEGASVDGPLA